MNRLSCKLLSICLTLAALTASGAVRAELWLTVSGLSWHTDRSSEYCEVNPGLGIEYRPYDSALAYMAGHYKNSYCDGTTYLGAAWQPLQYGPVRAGVWAALATGYKSPVLVMPAVTLAFERVSLNLIAAPALGKYTGFAGLQLGVRLD